VDEATPPRAPNSATTRGCIRPRGGRVEVVGAKAGAELVACETNPIDAVWSDQPDAPPPRRCRTAGAGGENAEANARASAVEVKKKGRTRSC